MSEHVGMAFLVVILLLLVWILLPDKSEHIQTPGASSKYDTEASFLNDRAEFEANEVKFYKRYKT